MANRKSNKSKRGFAAMPLERRREIASKGGRVAHERGTAYEWDSKAAADAGRAGGKASAKRRRTRR